MALRGVVSANDHPSAAIPIATAVVVTIGQARLPMLQVSVALRDIQGWNTPNGPDKNDLLTAVYRVLEGRIKIRLVDSRATLRALNALKTTITTIAVTSERAALAPAAPTSKSRTRLTPGRRRGGKPRARRPASRP